MAGIRLARATFVSSSKAANLDMYSCDYPALPPRSMPLARVLSRSLNAFVLDIIFLNGASCHGFLWDVH